MAHPKTLVPGIVSLLTIPQDNVINSEPSQEWFAGQIAHIVAQNPGKKFQFVPFQYGAVPHDNMYGHHPANSIHTLISMLVIEL